MHDTIVALSSGALPAAIAVMRLSGPQAFTAAKAICGSLPGPRNARVRTLRYEGQTLDRALVLTFPGPETATGEDLVEFHLHGSRAVARAVEVALLGQPGVRKAVQGEFTRRALANGRIDLIEAEALGDLLAAETEAQRRMAIESGSGILRRTIDLIESQVLSVSARIELTLDFSDEEDATGEQVLLENARGELSKLVASIDQWTSAPSVDRLRDGYRVVLAGPPNAGKSTLLNSLAERDAAIVSDIAGTTRDRIEVPVSRDGIPFILTDTAGIRDRSEDPIEQLGIDLARSAMTEADIVLWLGDDPVPSGAVGIYAKTDLEERATIPSDRHGVSAISHVGLDGLWFKIVEAAEQLMPRSDGLALNERQRTLLVECSEFLKLALAESDPMLVAEQLKWARDRLNRITGASGTEQMLDQLFAGFCIGK